MSAFTNTKFIIIQCLYTTYTFLSRPGDFLKSCNYESFYNHYSNCTCIEKMLVCVWPRVKFFFRCCKTWNLPRHDFNASWETTADNSLHSLSISKNFLGINCYTCSRSSNFLMIGRKVVVGYTVVCMWKTHKAVSSKCSLWGGCTLFFIHNYFQLILSFPWIHYLYVTVL